jgi:dihydroorotate dehydrogenase
MQEGAQAISISPPRGALTTENGNVVTGRLFGPSLFPRSLDIVRSAAKLGIPIIGSGGVWSTENSDAMLSVGAMAVQVDAALWNPASNFSALF